MIQNYSGRSAPKTFEIIQNVRPASGEGITHSKHTLPTGTIDANPSANQWSAECGWCRWVPAVVFTSSQNTQVLSLAALSKEFQLPVTVSLAAPFKYRQSSKAIYASSSGTQVPKVLRMFFVASMLTYAFDVIS